jgi:hypothetical protein
MMTDDSRSYVMNQEYRSSSNKSEDQFQSWINEPIDRGIKNSGGIRCIYNQQTDKREFLVFVSKRGQSEYSNPWEDIVNIEEGVVHYWGDAKAKHAPNPDEPLGNSWVKEDYCSTYAKGDRENAPPVLLFENPEPGWVVFRGVCVITDMSIERHKDDGDTVVNYLYRLAILDADEVDLEWIHRKALTGEDKGGPDAWNKWVREGRISRYTVWKDKIRSRKAQQPPEEYIHLLEDIRTRLDDPRKGRKLEYLIKFLMDNMDNFADIEMTPWGSDKGIDLTGKVNLMANAQLRDVDTKIDFKAQVKNKSLNSNISGRELSRLASRIDDGEIGLFFTTSYYSKRAQEENYSTYPIRAFCGKDLVELLVQTDLTEDTRLTDDVVDEINSTI